MVNIDFIPSLSEIKAYPMHYLHELASESRYNATLYQYGPYLTYRYNDKALSLLLDNENNIRAWNPIFRLFCEVSSLLQCMNVTQSISDCKAFILQTIKRCQTDLFPHSSFVINIANDYMKKLRENQFENKMMESAILNFAPIVQYTGVLRKPEVEEFINTGNISEDIPLEDMIRSCIFDKDILPKIILNCDIVHKLHQNTTENIDIPEEIVSAYQEKDAAKLYYVLVYLRYSVSKEKQSEILSKIKGISDVYDNLISGNVINVEKAMEAFMYLKIEETYEEG